MSSAESYLNEFEKKLIIGKYADFIKNVENEKGRTCIYVRNKKYSFLDGVVFTGYYKQVDPCGSSDYVIQRYSFESIIDRIETIINRNEEGIFESF